MEYNASLIAFNHSGVEIFLERNTNLKSSISEVLIPVRRWGLINAIKSKYQNIFAIRVVSLTELEQIIDARLNHTYIIVGYNRYEYDIDFGDIGARNRLSRFFLITEDVDESNFSTENITVLKNVNWSLPKIENNKIIMYILETDTNDTSLKTVLMLKDKLNSLGLKTRAFSDTIIAPLFDIEYIYNYIEANSCISEKIVRLRQIFDDVLRNEETEILLINLNTGITPWSNRGMQYSDLWPLLSRMLSPDYCIVNMLANSLVDNWLKDNDRLFSAALNVRIDCYAIANEYYDNQQSEEYHRGIYIPCSRGDLRRMGENNCCGSEIFDYDDIDNICGHICRKLQRNKYVIE